MPELPEVETIRRGLEATAHNRTISWTDESEARLRKPRGPVGLDELVGDALVDFGRHGKHLTVTTRRGLRLVVHLGMTGKLLFNAVDDEVQPHTHARLGFEDGGELRFIDPRRFGYVQLHGANTQGTGIEHYGVDALAPEFDAAYLETILRTSTAPLKAFLLDQTKIAGVGNIYACEALWRARLSPRRKAANTPGTKVVLLTDAIVAVLEDSLAAGGTSFNDYVDSIGREGSFLFDVAVFRREGEPCPRGDGIVRRIVQSGRSTFYCPGCQR